MTLDCEEEHDLQLSRSSSAAAISERTLEECWSTLQRLFMHKSAMQQIQQQIPRVGLGTHGVPGATSLGGGTPGADTKPHQCQQCMKSFSSNHQLVQHIRVHTGEKPYKCSYCDRRFKQLSHVQQHTRLHTGERPYKCHLPDCGRAFIQLSNLQQHLRNHDAQVERAKNRPFHCNICGKGFATESSLRTHTSKELQLHLGVLQQHAALIGGPNATSCPVCHKLFLGTEALVDHMKHVHKEKSPPPSGAAVSQFGEVIHGSSGGSSTGNPPASQCISESSCGQVPPHPSATGGSNLNDSYLGKRRTANHPCPVCGKHYVNEGSLRKHLACHAETSQLTNSLRMWPCSVCQAVFTHENGLLTHMDSMRMDPKHQFAAQYVLSRAAAEQRERESILAATLAAGGGIGEARNLLPIGANNPGGSKCPSPSANSECSSNGRLSSSSASEHDHDPDHEHGLSDNENSSHNNNRHIANTNNNNNCTNNNNNNHSNNNNNNNNNCSSGKMNELRLPSANQYTMDTDLHVANRMSLMAAAAAAAGVDAPAGSVPSAAVQAAVVNLAAAMRMNNPSNGSALVGHSSHSHGHPHAALQHQQHHGEHPHAHAHPYHPHHHHHLHQQQQQQQQQQVSHAVNSNSRRSPTINVPNMNMNMNANIMPQQHHQASASNYSQHAIAPSSQVQSQPHHAHHHHPETSLRMHQQAEAILRSHTEAAFRLAASGGVKNESDHTPTATASSASNFGSSSQQQQQQQQQQQNQEQAASNPSSS
ncbi:uncharacterized protein LOC6651637 isoform X3 [Drosophila willistoni]|uniref:uncharacterized protein LOC6651637 isoform X3 n=1 Tax=Drosophila willistoni TaxID=7260 RepID=UPI000C26CFA8|nr:uncharacterized protein LOC6651637 isoform X3 [Drosophila willistoni]